MLGKSLNAHVKIETATAAGGGCINDCYILNTNAGKFFLKRNSAPKFPKMFEAEVKGLQLLNATVPGIAARDISTSEDEYDILLILEFIEKGSAQKEFWRDFARKLSQLHQKSDRAFGLDHDNYIGSLPQSNRNHNAWVSFFILERIEPQLRNAIDAKMFSKEIHRRFEKLFLKLEEIFPEEKPALLHGDLWSGNFMTGKDRWVRIIDPAVYFGFREMDLAMSKLFGGFDSSFYGHYNEFFPLEKGFEKRVDICNLYPLLVHVNLFGGHYVNEVESIVRRFG